MNEVDLRGPLRAGAADNELEEIIRAHVWQKWEGHKINHPDFQRPDRSMSMIGG
jgi:GTP 3',8-cyclase